MMTITTTSKISADDLRAAIARAGIPIYIIGGRARINPIRLSRILRGHEPFTDQTAAQILLAVQEERQLVRNDPAVHAQREAPRRGTVMLATTFESFRHAIEAGTAVTRHIPDGKIHRFQTNGHANDRSGWYVLHEDGVPAGAFGCFRSDIHETWSAQHTSTMTATERTTHQQRIEAMQRMRKAEQQKIQADAAFHADALWQHAEPATDHHPYLSRKRVRAHGLRVNRDDCLVVPVFVDDELASLQFIAPDGSKEFLKGGAVRGGYFLVNDGTADPDYATALVCEGFATAASLHEATGFQS